MALLKLLTNRNSRHRVFVTLNVCSRSPKVIQGETRNRVRALSETFKNSAHICNVTDEQEKNLSK